MLLLANVSEVFSYIGYGALAILILLVMITVHEFGHYIVGKIFHFQIDEFSIGFGPKLYSKVKKQKGNTKTEQEEVFSIRAFPLGGYCAFHGEDEEDDNPASFNNKKPYQRILVLIAGAFMNYLLALILIFTMFGAYGRNSFRINKVDASVSQEDYFEEGDVILSANGKNIYLTTDFMTAIENKKAGDTIDFLIVRNGNEINKKITLLKDTSFSSIEDTNTLLLSLGITEMQSCFVKSGFFETIGNGFEYSGKLAGTIFKVIHQLFTGKIGMDSMGGTVTTITTTTKAIKTGGFQYLLYIASFIGVNLAVFNLLPIPALDGSRVIFCLIEWIRKKPVNKKVEGIIHTVGFILLMAFAIFADLNQCF